MKVSLKRKLCAASLAMTVAGPVLLASTPVSAAGPVLTMTAKADLYHGVGAQALVRVNGEDVGQWMVGTMSAYADYNLTLPRGVTAGDKIDIRFANDVSGGGEDRNLHVKQIRVGDVTMPTEFATYDRGATWATATDGRSLMPPWVMPWDGALRFTMSGGVGTSNKSTGTTGPSGSAVAQPFANSSFWYQELPANAPINSMSARYVQNLREDVKKHWAAVNTSAYAPPIYVADSSTPRYAVRNTLCNGVGSDPAWIDRNWKAQFSSVPIPAGAKGSAGADSEIIIWSPSTDEIWEMWRFAGSSGNYSACWGGNISKASSSNGVFPYPFGVAASGLSLMGGTIRIAELQAGEINHAIAIGIDRPRADVYSWPANRTDGTWWSNDAIPEGTRFRLDPNLNVDSLGLDPVPRMIAKAAQKYGFIVRDNSFGPLVVYAEDSSPYVRANGKDPYDPLTNQEKHLWMKTFPWDRLQAMPKDYGK